MVDGVIVHLELPCDRTAVIFVSLAELPDLWITNTDSRVSVPFLE